MPILAGVYDGHREPLTEVVEKWRDMFAEFADQLAPSGSLSSRIRLGVKPDAGAPCPICGRTGTAMCTEERRWVCGGCARLFSMRRAVVEREGGFEIAGVSTCPDEDGTPCREKETATWPSTDQAVREPSACD